MNEEKGSIRRAQHDSNNPYVLVSRETVQDQRHSAESLACLVFVLSLPVGWRINPNHLMKHFKWGRNKIYNILKELIELGYLERSAIRNQSGRIVTFEYVMHETPCVKNQYMENQYMENQHINKETVLESKEKKEINTIASSDADMAAIATTTYTPQEKTAIHGELEKPLDMAKKAKKERAPKQAKELLYTTEQFNELQRAIATVWKDETVGSFANNHRTMMLLGVSKQYAIYNFSPMVLADELLSWYRSIPDKQFLPKKFDKVHDSITAWRNKRTVQPVTPIRPVIVEGEYND